MAARDNVLFGATITSGTAAGTVIPLSLVYGIENVRQGYGTPVLKSVRAVHAATYVTDTVGIPVRIKNTNWVDTAGLVSQKFSSVVSINRNSLSFMRGRDKILQPNTSWTIEAELTTQAAANGYIFVLLEIEYSDVPGISTDNASGSPVLKTCSNASVTGSALTSVSIGSFDNLLQGVTYVLSEVSTFGLSSEAAFVVIEGFGNQKGLVRIIPAKECGLADQIDGSVYLSKQTYNVSVINYTALSAAAVAVRMEMIASAN